MDKYVFVNETLESAMRYTINEPTLCEHDQGLMNVLLAAVVSKYHHFEQRQAIRETWGLHIKESGHKLMFLVGTPSAKDQTGSQVSSWKDKILAESKQHNDIVQTELEDIYANLSLKVIFWLTIKPGPYSDFDYYYLLHPIDFVALQLGQDSLR